MRRVVGKPELRLGKKLLSQLGAVKRQLRKPGPTTIAQEIKVDNRLIHDAVDKLVGPTQKGFNELLSNVEVYERDYRQRKELRDGANPDTPRGREAIAYNQAEMNRLEPKIIRKCEPLFVYMQEMGVSVPREYKPGSLPVLQAKINKFLEEKRKAHYAALLGAITGRGR
ncbi:hypothetical protein HY991_01255 [Candidatus Micrarchaeota archaeon]|nr:hypothetical protein [Candidatus Micrarchaeota archaeon]